jgi:nucleoid-associated protein YgaU
MDLDALKLKYQAVLNVIKQKGVVLAHLHVEGNKLFIQGAAPNEDIKNDVWNAIKATDLSIDSSLVAPVKTYTVEKGDSLWKIAAEQLGNGTLYPKIIAANSDRLKDEKSVIHPGDVLVIPEL